MNVFLIGYRASGKTSVGRKIASKLWKTFVDVDRETRKHFDDATIAEIWKTHGEPAWREAEVDVTRQLCAKDNQVIALGGGTLMQPDARETVESAADARCIYLSCAPEELHRRIQADAANLGSRPNLTDKGGGLEEIETVLAERDPVYRQVADFTFDVTHTGVDDVVRYLTTKYL